VEIGGNNFIYSELQGFRRLPLAAWFALVMRMLARPMTAGAKRPMQDAVTSSPKATAIDRLFRTAASDSRGSTC
jgi:hypothetical protein